MVRAHYLSTTRPRIHALRAVHPYPVKQPGCQRHDTRLGFQCVALTRRLVTRAVAGGGGRQTRCDVHGLVYPRQRVRSGRAGDCAGKLRVERTGEAAAYGCRLSTVHLPRGLGDRRVSLCATQRGFHGHPVAIGDAGPPCRAKRLEEEWTVKQTHLKAFNHLALPTPEGSNWPTPRQ